MTKRYFYTEPLAAAWMMKHHDMQIVDKYADEIGEAFRRDPSVWLDPPYYVHADSLHLLEPQGGDLITWEYPAGDFRQRHSYEVIHEGQNHNHFPANAKRLIEETGAQTRRDRFHVAGGRGGMRGLFGSR